ncbi:MAG: 23S rRNA (pseudouridine(1915)-N(3))-methyltransferase RlmH [Flavobacteriaceae bacterium]
MEIVLLSIGKIPKGPLSDSLAIYEKRLEHFCRFSQVILPDIKVLKNRRESEHKTLEAKSFKAHFKKGDRIVLLDENGRQSSSLGFSQQLQKWLEASPKRLVFVVGGPYGFCPSLKSDYKEQWALSSMTFSHQMVRLFFTEQLYRAFSILHKLPYHHQ